MAESQYLIRCVEQIGSNYQTIFYQLNALNLEEALKSLAEWRQVNQEKIGSGKIGVIQLLSVEVVTMELPLG